MRKCVDDKVIRLADLRVPIHVSRHYVEVRDFAHLRFL